MSNFNFKQPHSVEYYTQRSTLDEYLKDYKFYGFVYMPCDSDKSAFWQYFVDNFHSLHLTKIVATCISGMQYEYDGTSFNSFSISDGSFLSINSLSLAKEADWVVTNPPYGSLLRKFTQVLLSAKNFVALMPFNYPDCISDGCWQRFFVDRTWFVNGVGRFKYDTPDGSVKSVPTCFVSNINLNYHAKPLKYTDEFKEVRCFHNSLGLSSCKLITDGLYTDGMFLIATSSYLYYLDNRLNILGYTRYCKDSGNKSFRFLICTYDPRI